MKFMMKIRQAGFSLPEAMIGLGLLAGVGVAGMALNDNVSKSIKGTRSSGDLGSVMTEIRQVLYNPSACQYTFAGLNVGDGPTAIKDGNGTPLFQKATKVGNGANMLVDIRVVSLDPSKYRALVKFDFEKTQKEAGLTQKSYYINLFVESSGTQISRCIDPSEEGAKMALENFCKDADPVNNVPPGTNVDCEDNLGSVIAETKRLYCTSVLFLSYDVGTGKCRPLDYNRKCPVGEYLKGFGPNGELICGN